MDARLTVVLSVVLYCDGDSIRELAQIAKLQKNFRENRINARRFGMMKDESVILGAPSFPNHLPEAEAILPGHTLLRPAIGMLKSAVKFPHKELENGAGVYGNVDNLGLKYASRNERVLYTGFRRMLDDRDKIEANSDSSSDEVSRLLQKINQIVERNHVKKYIKVPTEMRGKNENNMKNKETLITKNMYYLPIRQLQGDNIDSYENTQPYYELNTYGRPKRDTKSGLDIKLHTSNNTLNFAKMLLLKLQANKPENQQKIVVLKSSDSESDEDKLMKPNNLYVKKKSKLRNALANQFLKKHRRQQNIVVLEPQDELSSGYTENQNLNDEKVTERPRNWFYTNQGAYNHVKISIDAPDQEEYLPQIQSEEENKDERKWWYYHQADFIPFPVDDV